MSDMSQSLSPSRLMKRESITAKIGQRTLDQHPSDYADQLVTKREAHIPIQNIHVQNTDTTIHTQKQQSDTKESQVPIPHGVQSEKVREEKSNRTTPTMIKWNEPPQSTVLQTPVDKAQASPSNEHTTGKEVPKTIFKRRANAQKNTSLKEELTSADTKPAKAKDTSEAAPQIAQAPEPEADIIKAKDEKAHNAHETHDDIAHESKTRITAANLEKTLPIATQSISPAPYPPKITQSARSNSYTPAENDQRAKSPAQVPKHQSSSQSGPHQKANRSPSKDRHKDREPIQKDRPRTDRYKGRPKSPRAADRGQNESGRESTRERRISRDGRRSRSRDRNSPPIRDTYGKSPNYRARGRSRESHRERTSDSSYRNSSEKYSRYSKRNSSRSRERDRRSRDYRESSHTQSRKRPRNDYENGDSYSPQGSRGGKSESFYTSQRNDKHPSHAHWNSHNHVNQIPYGQKSSQDNRRSNQPDRYDRPPRNGAPKHYMDIPNHENTSPPRVDFETYNGEGSSSNAYPTADNVDVHTNGPPPIDFSAAEVSHGHTETVPDISHELEAPTDSRSEYHTSHDAAHNVVQKTDLAKAESKVSVSPPRKETHHRPPQQHAVVPETHIQTEPNRPTLSSSEIGEIKEERIYQIPGSHKGLESKVESKVEPDYKSQNTVSEEEMRNTSTKRPENLSSITNKSTNNSLSKPEKATNGNCPEPVISAARQNYLRRVAQYPNSYIPAPDVDMFDGPVVDFGKPSQTRSEQPPVVQAYDYPQYATAKELHQRVLREIDLFPDPYHQTPQRKYNGGPPKESYPTSEWITMLPWDYARNKSKNHILPTKHGELAVSEEERKMRNMYKDELAELMFSCARKPEPYTFNNKPAERSIPETKLNSLSTRVPLENLRIRSSEIQAYINSTELIPAKLSLSHLKDTVIPLKAPDITAKPDIVEPPPKSAKVATVEVKKGRSRQATSVKQSENLAVPEVSSREIRSPGRHSAHSTSSSLSSVPSSPSSKELPESETVTTSGALPESDLLTSLHSEIMDSDAAAMKDEPEELTTTISVPEITIDSITQTEPVTNSVTSEAKQDSIKQGEETKGVEQSKSQATPLAQQEAEQKVAQDTGPVIDKSYIPVPPVRAASKKRKILEDSDEKVSPPRSRLKANLTASGNSKSSPTDKTNVKKESKIADQKQTKRASSKAAAAATRKASSKKGARPLPAIETRPATPTDSKARYRPIGSSASAARAEKKSNTTESKTQITRPAKMSKTGNVTKKVSLPPAPQLFMPTERQAKKALLESVRPTSSILVAGSSTDTKQVSIPAEYKGNVADLFPSEHPRL